MSTNKPKVNETEAVEVQAEATVKKKPNRKRLAIIVTASVAAVALAACAGAGIWRNQNVQALQNECSKVTTRVKNAQKSLAELVTSDNVTKALKVTDEQVLKEDTETITTLKDTVDSASEKVNVPDCEVDFFALDANPAESVRSILKTVQNKTTDVDDAVASVNKAVAAKTLADVKTKLQQTVDSASKLLADSDGKVADNATRDTLKKAVDQASALLKAGKESDPAQYATKPVDDAVAQVNASVEAKRQADEQAAAAAQAQRAYTPQNTYSGNSYSGGSSYTPPSNSSANSSNQSSNFDPTNIDAWGGQGGGEMPCQVVGTCQ